MCRQRTGRISCTLAVTQIPSQFGDRYTKALNTLFFAPPRIRPQVRLVGACSFWGQALDAGNIPDESIDMAIKRCGQKGLPYQESSAQAHLYPAENKRHNGRAWSDERRLQEAA